MIWFPMLTRFQPALPYLNPLILNRLRTLSSFRAVTLRRPSFISSDLRTLWRGLFSQPTYQCLPHSLRKTPGGTGSQFLRLPSFDFPVSIFDSAVFCSLLQCFFAPILSFQQLAAKICSATRVGSPDPRTSAFIRGSVRFFVPFNFRLSTADCFWLSFLP